MKYFNIFIITMAVIAIAVTNIHAQNAINKISADSIWKKMEAVRFGTNDDVMRDVTEEYRRRYLFEEGLKFWNSFPDDIRKYEWLRNQLSFFAPAFWKDVIEGAKQSGKQNYYTASLDKEAFFRWDSIKNDLMTFAAGDSINLDIKERLSFSSNLYYFIMRSRNAAFRDVWPDYVSKIKEQLDSVIVLMANPNFTPSLHKLTEPLFWGSDNLDLSLDALKALVSPHINSNIPEVKKWAHERMALLRLSDKPIDLIMSDGLGNKADLKKLHGKVVLIDIWGIGCSICIARMPEIKKIYDQYKTSGFEVISACTDSEDKYERVMAIKKKIAADWPTILLGGKNEEVSHNQAKTIMERYGFTCVPQLLLFDKQGKMVMLNGSLQTKDFGDTVKRLLNEK